MSILEFNVKRAPERSTLYGSQWLFSLIDAILIFEAGLFKNLYLTNHSIIPSSSSRIVLRPPAII